MDTINALIVDDHALFRKGIAAVLQSQDNIEVVGEGVDGLDGIKLARELQPDVILMDLNMPRCSGLEATQVLQGEYPEMNILVLTVSDNESDLFAAMKCGARGYILKNAEPEELTHAINHIARGGVIVSPLMATRLLNDFPELHGCKPCKKSCGQGEEESKLSPREMDVLRLVSDGATNREIGEALFISENTVKTHLQKIMDKLHLANRSQAAAYAVRNGLLPFSEG